MITSGIRITASDLIMSAGVARGFDRATDPSSQTPTNPPGHCRRLILLGIVSPVHQRVPPSRTGDVALRTLSQVPFHVAVDLAHMSQVVVSQVAFPLSQQADDPAPAAVAGRLLGTVLLPDRPGLIGLQPFLE